MTKTFRPYSPDQLLLLPPSLREWLPADHPVRVQWGGARVSSVSSGVDDEADCLRRQKCSRPAWRTWPFGSWRLDKPPTFARSRPSVPAIWRHCLEWGDAVRLHGCMAAADEVPRRLVGDMAELGHQRPVTPTEVCSVSARQGVQSRLCRSRPQRGGGRRYGSGNLPPRRSRWPRPC